jgi:mono/diheme cytochrome c family protein
MRSADILLIACAFAFAVGCGGSDESPAAKPTAPAASPEKPSPPPAPSTPAKPAAQPSTASTGAATEVDPSRGAPLYATYCASCHGPGGDGDGPVAATLDPKPAAHSDAAYMDTLTDEHLVLVISKGGPAVGKSPLMAGWAGTLNDRQIVDVVAYIRTLSQ